MRGAWAVSPGQLTRYGTVVEVLENEEGFRLPTARGPWGVDPDADLVVLRCHSGRAEWALPRRCREAVLQTLLQEKPPTPATPGPKRTLVGMSGRLGCPVANGGMGHASAR